MALETQKRYKDVDYSRLRDPSFYVGSIGLSQFFLNASHIRLRNQQYIATQYPLCDPPQLLELFWKKVNDEARVIFDLTNRDDYSYDKFPNFQRYIPTDLQNTLEVGSITVLYVGKEAIPHIESTTLYHYLVINKGSRPRTAKRIHFEGWPDGRGLSTENILKLTDLLKKYIEGSQRCPIIHCMAGIGRTMTFIVTHYLKVLIDEKQITTASDLRSHIEETILDVRGQRSPVSVLTPEQVQTIWDATYSYLQEKMKTVA